MGAEAQIKTIKGPCRSPINRAIQVTTQKGTPSWQVDSPVDRPKEAEPSPSFGRPDKMLTATQSTLQANNTEKNTQLAGRQPGRSANSIDPKKTSQSLFSGRPPGQPDKKLTANNSTAQSTDTNRVSRTYSRPIARSTDVSVSTVSKHVQDSIQFLINFLFFYFEFSFF